MKTVGVTVGKFMPLHKGHELMIEFGSRMLDEFHVFVSGTAETKFSSEEPFTIEQRCRWVKDFIFKHELDNVTVHYHVDKSPTPINIDENGTVLDEGFQSYWANELFSIPALTHIVSSDMYGKTLANLMGLRWLPVDPKREMVNISATKIRSDYTKYFDYISDSAKPDLVKTVAIVGPESVGKSTLLKDLKDIVGCSIVTEYGRTLSEAKDNNLTNRDFRYIADAQFHLIQMAKERAKIPLVVADTEAFTTLLYAETYLKGDLDEYTKDYIEYTAIEQPIDHYIVLAPTVPWVDDGTRVQSSEEQREQFFVDIVELLKYNNKDYTIIDDEDYLKRGFKVDSTIKKLYDV